MTHPSANHKQSTLFYPAGPVLHALARHSPTLRPPRQEFTPVSRSAHQPPLQRVCVKCPRIYTKGESRTAKKVHYRLSLLALWTRPIDLPGCHRETFNTQTSFPPGYNSRTSPTHFRLNHWGGLKEYIVDNPGTDRFVLVGVPLLSHRTTLTHFQVIRCRGWPQLPPLPQRRLRGSRRGV